MAIKYWPWRCVRLPVLGFILLQSAIVGFLDGVTGFLQNGYNGLTNGYGDVGVSVALITFLTVLPMLIIDIVRPGRFVSWVAVELGWFTVLWILWLAAAAVTTSSGCLYIFEQKLGKVHICPTGFFWYLSQVGSYLSWVTLMAYTAFLIYACIIRRRRGHNVIWTATVRDTDFLDWKSETQHVRSPMLTFHITKFWPWKFVRLPVLAFVVLFSAAVLGSGIQTIIVLKFPYPIPNPDNDHYGAVAVGAACVTLVSVVPMLIVDYVRPGSVFSWVAVELGWFLILSLLWLSTALVTSESRVSLIFSSSCTGIFLLTASISLFFPATVCQVWKVIQAFAFLNFLFLMSYTGFLINCLAVRKQRGHKIFWTATVRDTDFLEWKSEKRTLPRDQSPAPEYSVRMQPIQHNAVIGDEPDSAQAAPHPDSNV